MARLDPTRGGNPLGAKPEIAGRGRLAESDAMLWRQIAGATSPEAFCAAWLNLLCGMIQGVNCGVVLLGAPEEGRSFAPAAFWPDQQRDFKHLADVAERALRERRALILKRPAQVSSAGPARERYDIAYPIEVAARMCSVAALDIEPRPEEQLNEVMRQLQWGSAWLELLYHRSQGSRDSALQGRLQAVVETIATAVSQDSFRGAAVAFATGLAVRFDCDRVSLGFPSRGHIRVEALSHSAQFKKETNLMRAIGNAMDEAFDQQTVINYPSPPGEVRVTRAHAELARQYGNGALCSMPFSGNGRILGILTFERPAERPFDRGEIDICEAIVGLAGPMLEVRRREDRSLVRKVIDAGQTQLAHVIGPHHVALKLAVFGSVFLLLFLTFAKTDYRLTAKTIIEPATRRAIVAAFNGYIGEAPLRAGDRVRKGEILCRLDDRELTLERSKWQSQLEQSTKQYYEALGNRNAAQVQILLAQVDQARSQVALIDDQLARTRVIAPFDGEIVTGDLSQSLGAPVERGQVLFEVAPLDAYRVVLQVDERTIAEVRLAQKGHLVLTGFPNDPLPFTVAKITPVSTATEGRNYFRVEAELQSIPQRLRPGMEGVGKIEIDRRRYLWIWTHDVVDWISLKLWYWSP